MIEMNKDEKETLRLLTKFNVRPVKYSIETIEYETRRRLKLRQDHVFRIVEKHYK